MYSCLIVMVSHLTLMPGAVDRDAEAVTAAPAAVARIELAQGAYTTNRDANPVAPTLGRCRGVRSIKSQCRERWGQVRVVVKFRKNTWDGRVVTIGVEENVNEITVTGNKARYYTCCVDGAYVVELLEPDRCLDPLEASCPN